MFGHVPISVICFDIVAKLFINGRNQAVCLSADYWFDPDEVFIRQDFKTGDVILPRNSPDWDGFLRH